MTLARALQVAAGNSQETGDVAEAIDFDGTNDYLSRSSDLTGNADGKTFTFSAWFWYDGTATGYIYREFVSGQGYFHCRVESSGKIAFAGANTAGTAIFLAEYDLAALPPFKNTFYHILVSVDLANTANRYWYVNDQLVSPAWTTYSNQNIDFTTAAHAVGANVDGSLKFDGRLSNVFLDYTYRNLSVEANRRLFVTADLKPAAGQAALNPILYLPMNDPTAPGANAGTGGNFTLTGTVARSGRGPNQYNAPYSDFDGSADYLSRTTAPTGIVDGKQFTLHFSFQPDTVSAAGNILWFGSSTTDKFSVQATSTGYLNITAYDTTATLNFQVTTLSVYNFVVGRNYVIDCSVDLTNTSKRHLIINGETIAANWNTYVNADFDFAITATPKYFVGLRNTSGYLNGRIGAFWFDTSYIDLSVAGNLAKFVTGTGIDAKPVDLGANGELPTGTSPLIYLPMYGNNAGKNYGTGGDFTVNSGPYTGARGPNEFWGNKTVTTNGYLNRTSALSGVSDGNKFSLNFWFRPAVSGTNASLFSISTSGGTSLRFFVFRTSANALRVYGRNSAGTIVFDVNTTGPSGNGFLANNNYYVQIGIDLSSTGSRSIYVNGEDMVSYTTWTTYNTAGVITFSQVIQAFMAYNSSGTYADLFNGQLSEFYFTTDYIDFSQEANRLKFRDAFGNPVNLTQQIEDAAIPNPAIYMRFPPTSFGTNSGTGGNFTVNGTITDGGQL